MDFIQRYKLNMENIEKLKVVLEEKNGVVKKYQDEIQPLKEQIAEIGRRYDIENVKKEISQLSKEIEKPANHYYITFLSELIKIAEECDEKQLYFEVEDYFDHIGLWLNNDFESIGVNDTTYVEGHSVYGEDSDGWEDVEIIEFERERSVEELDAIIKNIRLCIACEELMMVIAKGLDNKYISDKTKEILKKYGIEYIGEDNYKHGMIITEYDIEDESKIIASTSFATKRYLKFDEKINISEIISIIDKEIDDLKEKLKEDKDYVEYLKLKEKFG